MEPKKCEHGFYLGPNGEHIIPKNEAVSLSEFNKTHDVEPSMNHVIISGPYANRQTKYQKELELDIQERKKFYDKNRGLIPADFPTKTIFNKETKQPTEPEVFTIKHEDKTYTVTETKNTGVNQVKKLDRLLHGLDNY